MLQSNKAIFALYYALLACGYDFYAAEKDAVTIGAVESFRAKDTPAFFCGVRPSACAVYPY